jgi:phospholipase C
MMRRHPTAIAMLAAALSGVALLALSPSSGAAGPAAASSGAAAAAPTRTPIKHFVMLMQEGHSFDNYFGRYPGADGIPPRTCMRVDPARRESRCYRPFHLGDRSANLPHSALTYERQHAAGRMNGFVAALADLGVPDPKFPMGFYDDRDIPFYWNVADDYVLFDRFFAAGTGGSVMNHMYWVTGTPGDPAYPDSIPPQGFGSLPTIFDRLNERRVSWKVYVEDYKPTITYRTAARHRRASQATWMPLLSYARYLDNPGLNRHIVDISRLFSDADRGKLPAVAYVVPANSSEHPPGRIQGGVGLVRRIVNSMTLSPSWPSSAFMWTYDTWGGWYDHVPPPRVDAYGNGFRVPALMVSAYARRGRVDHTRMDVTSALRFIEDNWRLRPLATRDAKANSLAGAFDFAAGPRPPAILPLGRGTPAPRVVRRSVIYAGYGGAAIFAGLLVVLALGREWLGRRDHSRRVPGGER